MASQQQPEQMFREEPVRVIDDEEMNVSDSEVDYTENEEQDHPEQSQTVETSDEQTVDATDDADDADDASTERPYQIPRIAFKRLVRGIVRDNHPDYKLQAGAVDALQEVSEAYISDLMNDARICAIHAGRDTLKVADIALAKRMINKHV